MYIFYVIIGVLGGASNILSRFVNAELTSRIGAYRSTRMNYITGLSLSLLLLLIMRPALPAFTAPSNVSDVAMYFGGALGVAVVLIANLIAMRMSALVMTILVFISQMITGMVLDFFITGAFIPQQLVGALLLLIGLLLYQRPAPAKQ